MASTTLPGSRVRATSSAAAKVPPPEMPQKMPSRVARSRAVSRASTSFTGFNLNLAKAPFQDVRVRQAFRLLADRQELVARGLNGFGRIANDLYSPHDPTYNHALAQRPYDLDQARSLLRQAGQSDLRVELTTTANEVNAALVFAQQAKKAGVEVKVTPVEPLKKPVSLKAMKLRPALGDMAMLRQSRLSVAALSADEWAEILAMAGNAPGQRA